MSDKEFFFRKVMQTMWGRAEIRFRELEAAKNSATVEEEHGTVGAAIARDQVTDEPLLLQFCSAVSRVRGPLLCGGNQSRGCAHAEPGGENRSYGEDVRRPSDGPDRRSRRTHREQA